MNASNEPREFSPGEIVYPKCPYCETTPAMVRFAEFSLGSLAAMVLFCGNPNCAKIFTAVPLGSREQEQPRIVLPGELN